MPDNLYRRNKTWYARIQVAGQERRWSLKTANRAEAERRLKMELANISPYHGSVRKKATDVIDAYLSDAETTLKPKTLARYLQSAVKLHEHIGDQWWEQIDKKAVLQYISDRKAEGVKIPTIRRDLTVLSGAAEYAKDQDWSGTNPVTLIGKRALRYKQPVFVRPSPEDIELALSCVHGPLQDMCRFIRETGLRRDEAVFLTWDDVDIKRAAARLTETKSSMQRTISLSNVALNILNSRPRHISSNLCFPRNDGEPYQSATGGWREATARAKKRRATFKHFGLHGLRHIFAIEALEAGGNLYTLQQQLGHGSIRQTEWYLQFLTPEEQMEAKMGVGTKVGTTPTGLHLQ